MLKPLATGVERVVVASIIRASTSDITRLTERAYLWLMLRRGFVSHYHRSGFVAYYGFPRTLAAAVLEHEAENTEGRLTIGNDTSSHEAQVTRMYKAVCDEIRKATNN